MIIGDMDHYHIYTSAHDANMLFDAEARIVSDISLKGSSHNFFRLNLNFWIVLGCGIDRVPA